MRVIHLIKTGYGANWALRQIEILIKNSIEVHVFIGEDGPMIDRYISVGAKVHRLEIDIAKIRPWNLPKAINRFRHLINELSPDLIHSHFVGTTLFMRIALRSKKSLPRLFQVAGPLHLEKFLPRWVEILTANSSDYWVPTCQLTKNLYIKFGISSDRLHLSYYGTALEKFKPPCKRDETRVKLNLSPTTYAIGMVAFMYPPRRLLGQQTGIKGHEDLIDALKILRDQGRDVIGVFIGGAWGNADWYEKRVRSYGYERLGNNALFLGNRSDVPTLYEAIDVAVHPSHSENVGGAVESLLLGVPTIASNIGGFPDVVIDGETGLLSSPKDPNSLALCIARMLDDLGKARDMAIRGQNLCVNLFDVNRTGHEIAEIYRSVTSEHATKLNYHA